MSLITTTTTSPSTLPGSGLIAFTSSLIAGIREHFRIRKSINELRELSPETLKDIGIERSEIERIARFGR